MNIWNWKTTFTIITPMQIRKLTVLNAVNWLTGSMKMKTISIVLAIVTIVVIHGEKREFNYGKTYY